MAAESPVPGSRRPCYVRLSVSLLHDDLLRLAVGNLHVYAGSHVGLVYAYAVDVVESLNAVGSTGFDAFNAGGVGDVGVSLGGRGGDGLNLGQRDNLVTGVTTDRVDIISGVERNNSAAAIIREGNACLRFQYRKVIFPAQQEHLNAGIGRNGHQVAGGIDVNASVARGHERSVTTSLKVGI